MKTKNILSLLLALCLTASLFTATVYASDQSGIKPSTWSATDGLGRNLSLYDTVGAKREDRFVGMFYWIWHYPWTADTTPVIPEEILKKYPEAINDFSHPAWNNTYDGRPHFWGKPLYGFYTNTDEYVLRKHAELLADADIDTVIFDATNGTQVFPEGYEALLKAWSDARKDGVSTPDVMFILNFTAGEEARTQLYSLYDNLYSQGRYKDLWFMWEGKPLIMADIRSLDLKNAKDREIYNFFTFRDNESTYFADDYSVLSDTWGWCSDYPQTKFGKDVCGNIEQMCVSVAQNANEYGLTAMNSPVGTVQGRSFTDGAFSYTYNYGGKDIIVDRSIENSLLYGLNFQQQWDYAISQDPEFIFVTGFNEWIAGRFESWMDVENAFPDQFNAEYSRDIEPSDGILKDHYYYQLVENVRRFKGAEALGKTEAGKTIDISGDISQWDKVYPEYIHYEGGKTRDSHGWKDCYYVNDTFRNDIVKAKVAYDSENIYFYVETADTLTPCTDENWMRLLIDTDTTGVETNWEGFEYIINRNSPEDGKALLEKCMGDLGFSAVCEISISVSDNVLQLSVPREALGLTGDRVKFNFKWSDNHMGTDAMDFYVNGDSAPGGRFAFTFDSASEDAPETEARSESCFADFCKKIISFLSELRKFAIYLFR